MSDFKGTILHASSKLTNSTSANNQEGGMKTQTDNLQHFQVHDGGFFGKYLSLFERQFVFL